MSAADCFGAIVTPFGSPEPGIYAGAIVPGGSALREGGLLVGAPIDLTTHRARISAIFEPSIGCDEDCVESVAVGVTAQDAITSTVRPIAGLVYSSSLHRMSLVVGDVAVHRFEGVTAAERFTLDLEPSGVLTVERGEPGAGGERFEATFVPPASARVVIWGRSINPPPDVAPTRLSGFQPTVSLCDVPTAWRARRAITVRDTGGTVVDGDVRAPSFLDTAEGRLLAFEQGGAIHLARRTTGDEHTLVSDAPILEANDTIAWMSASVGDPELVAIDGGGVELWFTARGDRAWIGRVALAPTLDALAGAPEPITVAASTRAFDTAAIALFEPTLYHHASGEWVLAARGSLEPGAEEIVVLRSHDRASFTFHDAERLAALTRRPVQTPLFDADELSHPSLVIHNGAWQLYYAGRRGARSAIGLFLSDDLVEWRRIDPEEPVLRSTRDTFDSVAVSAPDVTVTPSGLELTYEASDGVRSVLGAAERVATDRGRL
jgi:hypothetical protein